MKMRDFASLHPLGMWHHIGDRKFMTSESFFIDEHDNRSRPGAPTEHFWSRFEQVGAMSRTHSFDTTNIKRLARQKRLNTKRGQHCRESLAVPCLERDKVVVIVRNHGREFAPEMDRIASCESTEQHLTKHETTAARTDMLVARLSQATSNCRLSPYR